MSVMTCLFAFVALACIGCTVADPEVDTTTQALVIEDGCPPKECGSNSSVIDGVYFYELSRQLGEPNSEGVRVLGYAKLPAGATRLDIRDTDLVARNAVGKVIASGSQLVGSGFVLSVAGKQVVLEITGFHRTLRYWAADDGTQLSSYTFAYEAMELDPSGKPTKVMKPLCTVVDLADGEAALDAFVFAGDRYNPTTKKVTTGTITKGWFNLACLGGAPAKMFRMRAAAASSEPTKGIKTTVAQRQSLFNMWIANYCGDGTPFTVPGEPLRVRDAQTWIPHVSEWSWKDAEAQLGSYEAVWGPTGAVCLEVPRRDDHAPGYRTVIEDHCKTVGHNLPSCSELFPDKWPTEGYYASGNPIGS